ncbi:MAG: rhodanese-like domain-containing protein [marine benthic group bacterium]|nr:rhodanese-like domain-containing protein [Candidatus Benthicola marisminoris]
MVRRRVAQWLIAAVVVAVASGCSGEGASSQSSEEVAENATAAPPAAEPVAVTVVTISAAALVESLDDPQSPAILDVRSQKEFDAGHIPGAIHLPYDQVEQRIGELEAYRDRGLVVYCRTGRRAGIAEETLLRAGFDRVWDLDGHMVEWQRASLPLAVPAVN